MPLQALTLDTIKNLDFGKALETFQVHLARVAGDCFDRPGDGKARTVTMTFSVVPVLADDGDCSEVRGQFHVTSKVPTHRTRVYSFGLRRNGLVFNEDSPGNVAQGTLYDNDDATDSEA